MTNDLLFIYGTLLQPGNEFGSYLQKNATFYSKGKLKGVLYDLGDYPAAVYDPQVEGYVYGDVVRLNYPNKTFKILDQYEGFGDDGPQPNLFVRRQLNIESSGQVLRCWAYLYNLPVGRATQIISGDYLTYKAK